MIKVITHGTYDLFHYGHQRLLKGQKALGDYLIVGLLLMTLIKTGEKSMYSSH